MVVIADFEVPADQFPLGRLFEAFPGIEIELERVIPISSRVIPLLWVSGVDPEEVEHELRAGSLVEDVALLTHADDRCLFQVDWSPDINGLIQSMVEADADLLRGEGGPEIWEFRVQFRTREHLVAFREACLDHDLRLELTRLYNPQLPAKNQLLTDAQLDALLLSYDNGYWDVPRETTLIDLGETIGISDTATSQRMRRAVKTLIEEYVLPEADR